MGRFRERDGPKKDDSSSLEEFDGEENIGERYRGTVEIKGVDQALDKIRENDSNTSQSLEEPCKVLPQDEIDFEEIRKKTNHMYFVNSQDHLDTPKSKALDIDIQGGYEAMTEALMGYIQNDGIEALHQYVEGSLENDVHWANLVGLGIVEGEQNLSNLGEYLGEQVFEYSE